MTIPTDIQNLVGTGAILSLFGTLAYSLRSIPATIWRKLKQKFIYSVTVYDYDELFTMIEKWLYAHHEGKYRTVRAHYYEKDNQGMVIYRQESDVFYLKYKGKYIVFSKNKEKMEHAQTVREQYAHQYSISGFRAKEVIKSLFNDIMQFTNNGLDKDLLKIRYGVYGDWGQTIRKRVKPLSKVILNKKDKTFLESDITDYTNKQQWYIDVNIPYKRTYLFHGLPGCGKSTLAQSIASELNKTLCVLNLSSVANDNELMRTFTNVPENGILLIEDIDAAFVSRENKDSKVSFSCLLNCLDGTMSKEGLITIITTNHIEKLDPALIRPGRIDVKMEIKPAGCPEIEEFLTLFYGERVILDDKDIELPMSAVQEICIRNKNNLKKALYELQPVTA
jgi:chaperone BCS1